DIASTYNYTTSLHDALPIFSSGSKQHLGKVAFIEEDTIYYAGGFMGIIRVKNNNEPKYFYQLLNTLLRQSIRDIGSGSNINNLRSEEHTSELQSRENLVCRL